MKATKTKILIVLLLISAIHVKAYLIHDTGQTKCYNSSAEIFCPALGAASYGLDGDYIILAPSYIKLDVLGTTLYNSASPWTMVKDNMTALSGEIG
jgi:hypothetical protein